MKQIAALLVLLLTATTFCEEPAITEQQRVAMKKATEYHTFTTADGKELIGRTVAFTDSTSSVKLKMTDGSNKTFPLSTLSEKDKAFIQDWRSTHFLLSRKKLRITLDKRKAKTKQRSSYRSRTQDEKEYEFTLQNRSENSLSDVHIEYCIYVHTEVEKQTTKGRQDPPDPGIYTGHSLGWVSLGMKEDHPTKIYTNEVQGTFHITQLSRRDSVVKKTQPLVLPNDQDVFTFSDFLRTGTTTDTKLLGIRYRVYLPTPAGNYAMMEFAEPKSLLKETEWPDKSNHSYLPMLKK